MIKMAHNLPRMGDPSVGEGSEQTAASSRCGSSASESYAIGGTQEQKRARTRTNALQLDGTQLEHSYGPGSHKLAWPTQAKPPDWLNALEYGRP